MRQRIDWALRRATRVHVRDFPRLSKEILHLIEDVVRRPRRSRQVTTVCWTNPLLPPSDAVLKPLRERVLLERVKGPECAGKHTGPLATRRWHQDALHFHRWKHWPGPLVPHRFAPVDVLHTWHLHRLNHVARSAILSLWDADEAHTWAAQRELEHWIQSNRTGWGIGWSDALEVGFRTISILLIASALPRAHHPPLLTHVLSESGRWLMRYPSQGSSVGNHTVGEAAALCTLSACASDLPFATQWRKIGRTRLENALLKILAPDGLSREQSVGYTATVLEWALLADRAVGGLCEEVRERLRHTAQALSILCGDGLPPAIGDEDGTGVLNDGQSVRERTRSVARVAAALLGAPGPRSGQLDLRAHLLGASDPATLVPRKGACFPVTGWSVLWGVPEAPEWHVVVGHGPLGLVPRMAHGHDDALSVWATLGGEPVLVDRGTPTYNADDRQREWCRSAAAHPTVILDGQSPSHPVGRFTWGKDSPVGDWSWRPDRVTAHRVAYPGAQVRIGRTVSFDGPALCIEDDIQGTGHHHVAQWWPLPEGATVQGKIVTLPSGRQVAFDVPERCEIQSVPTLHANRYGHPTTATSLRTTCEVNERTRLRVRIVPL
jgi:hypothetical protein